ncbi:MAG: hypothetical protein AAF318_19060 [Pseudomonadota bacterium]
MSQRQRTRRRERPPSTAAKTKRADRRRATSIARAKTRAIHRAATKAREAEARETQKRREAEARAQLTTLKAIEMAAQTLGRRWSA